MKIGIVNYGLGNIKSIKNAIFYADKSVDVNLVDYPDQLSQYDKIILPGVGAFGDAIKLIRDKNFDESLLDEKNKGKYIFGICLGMQLLATKSYEFGEHTGLNLIPGEVIKFKNTQHYHVPHVGWNNLEWDEKSKLFENIENKSDFYFVHSYYFNCSNKNHSIGYTNYINKFTSVVKEQNVLGTQFHPEKSQKDGIQLIKNFIDL